MVPQLRRAPVAESLPDNRQEGETAPSHRKAMKIMRERLGITGAQAHALLVAYQRDVADAVRVGNDTLRSDSDFIDWLMRQYPGGRKPSRRHWRVGEGGGLAVRS